MNGSKSAIKTALPMISAATVTDIVVPG